MGNISLNNNLFKYNQAPWQLLHHTPHQQLMIHPTTGLTAQAQTLTNLNQQYINSLQLRTRNNTYLVDVLAILKTPIPNPQNTSTICFQNLNQNCSITVLIQNINYRLPDLGTITYHEAIYVLYQSLKGIRAIASSDKLMGSGFEEEMIGFNREGQCKIWLNTNYFKDIQPNQSQTTPTQKLLNTKQLITSLLTSIEGRMNCYLTKSQQQQYKKTKQLYLKQFTYQNNIEYLDHVIHFVSILAQSNDIRFQSFQMGIVDNQLSNKQYQLSSFNNNISEGINYLIPCRKINYRNKISLKKKIIADKKNISYGNQSNNNCQEQSKKTHQTTLNSSMQITNSKVKPFLSEIGYKNINHTPNNFGIKSTHYPTNLLKKQLKRQISRSTITKDSQCSITSKNMLSPQKIITETQPQVIIQ